MDGLLIVDKPMGMTSHDVVFRVRKLLGESRIGHTGTLDPMATGVLVLCVGRATKLVTYLTDHDKRYEAEVRLGIETDTLDLDGEVVRKSPCPELADSAIDEALQGFLGPQMQLPPRYSAVKVDGRKLYEYARKNQPLPEIAPRRVVVHDLKRTGAFRLEGDLGSFPFSLHCGKGFYVRALVRDLGIALGTPSTLSQLRRTAVGIFTADYAIPLTDVGPQTILRDPFPALGMVSVTLPETARKQVENGAFLPPDWFPSTETAIIRDGMGKPMAIYEYDERIDKMRLSVKW